MSYERSGRRALSDRASSCKGPDIKRIFIPTTSGTDWQRLLAKPRLHWQKGASAMTAAASWEASDPCLPPEITRLLDSTADPALINQRLVAAFPEWQVALPGGTTNSCTDVLAVCRNDSGLCVMSVEAKVKEDFGPLLGEMRLALTEGQGHRLAYLHQLLNVTHFEDGIRYQLLHRTASALLTAQEFHASIAAMVVHAFETPQLQRDDFLAFTRAMGARELIPLVYRVPAFTGPSLYLAWCDGDASFRRMKLPSADF